MMVKMMMIYFFISWVIQNVASTHANVVLPAASTNIALHKIVWTAAAKQATTSASKIVDGDSGSLTDIVSSWTFLAVDLGERFVLERVELRSLQSECLVGKWWRILEPNYSEILNSARAEFIMEA